MKISVLHELAYTELILSIDVRTISGKVVFNIVKECNNKNLYRSMQLYLKKGWRTGMSQPVADRKVVYIEHFV
jgi:hypothetical protein